MFLSDASVGVAVEVAFSMPPSTWAALVEVHFGQGSVGILTDVRAKATLQRIDCVQTGSRYRLPLKIYP